MRSHAVLQGSLFGGCLKCLKVIQYYQNRKPGCVEVALCILQKFLTDIDVLNVQ